MSWGRFARWGLAVLAAGFGCVLLGQLSVRADRAAEAAVAAQAAREDAAVVRTAWSVSLMFDRARTQANLVRGWSNPEPGTGTWSDAREAVARLPTPTTDGDLDLALTLSEVFLAPGLPAQRVVLRAGDTPIAAWRLTNPREQILHATAPRQARSSRNQIELHFELPDADAPMRRVFGAMEPRVLAIKLKRAELTVAAPSATRSGPACACS